MGDETPSITIPRLPPFQALSIAMAPEPAGLAVHWGAKRAKAVPAEGCSWLLGGPGPSKSRHAYIHIHIHIYTYMIYVYLHMCIHICRYIYIYVHVYIHVIHVFGVYQKYCRAL